MPKNNLEKRLENCINKMDLKKVTPKDMESGYNENIEALHNHEHFARFISVIDDLREQSIGELSDATTDKIQQISGRIIAFDDMLQLSGWKNLEKRYKDLL